MRRMLVIALSGLLLVGCGGGSETAETSVEIPFVKFTLDNGLDVILHEDHSDPIVAIATLVHVGSNREKPGRTGFAHFFEHMSFNDSENVPRGANRKMIGELGGTRNGGTWTDGTIYYEVVPKDAFEKLMWIDSDRLGYMINTVTEAALENEKQVVKNEKRQNYDNRAYGHTNEVIVNNLYPAGHPYSWTTIGSLEDLQNATLEDVREFYDRYYGPNNTTLVVAGDIDVDETRSLVEKWFGEIKRGPDVQPMQPQPANLKKPRSLFHLDRLAKLPELRLTFPTVEVYHEDAYALDALGTVLSEGKRAPLYRTIVEERKLAPSVSAYHDAREVAGSFTIRVRANADIPLDQVKQAIDEALKSFEKDGVSAGDLERIKAEAETSFYEDISGVLDRAFNLASYNEFAGDPGFIAEDLARVRAVTIDDILDVYERYLKDKPFVMTSFVPEDAPELVVSGATRADIVEEQIVQNAEPVVDPTEAASFEKTQTTLDRSEPPLGPAPTLQPPAVWTAETRNGLSVLGIEHNELPLVELDLRLTGGQLLEDRSRSGMAVLLGQLMLEGTKNRTPEELEDAIGQLGASVRVRADEDGISLRAGVLARNFEPLMALIEEILLEPRWDAEEFERLKSSQLTRLRQREGDPSSLASMAFSRLLYGDAHNYGLPLTGTVKTVSQIQLDDLKGYYAKAFSPKMATLHLAGAVPQKRVLAALKRLEQDWEGQKVSLPSFFMPGRPDEPQLYFLDVPGAKQSVIYVGQLALRGKAEDYRRLQWANNRLGAGSSARLFQLLRIQKGYTYGAGSVIPRRLDVAPFMARTSVRSNVTLESLELLRDQIKNYRATFTEDDLATTKNLLLKQATRDFETLGDLLGILREISAFDLPLDYIQREQEALMSLSLEEVHGTIDRYMDESQMIYVVVGDAASQVPRLTALGYGEPQMLGIDGVPVAQSGSGPAPSRAIR